jgi:DNA-binding NtrC family response regulator
MARPLSIADSLTKLLDKSDRPIYIVDPQRRIVYCNPALAEWIDLERMRIVGRRVEFHSEEPSSDAADRKDVAPLIDLCPPPSAIAGEPSNGTISCQTRDGRMLYRAAEFVPLGRIGASRESHTADEPSRSAVLVLLAAENFTTQELAKEISSEPTADDLHRTIRQFRRAQARRYSIKSLLGPSPAMQKVRAQVEAAAKSGANTIVYGPAGSGRHHVALAIHYHSCGDEEATLLPISCRLLTEDQFSHTLERLRGHRPATAPKPTLIWENLESMPPQYQSLLVEAIRQNRLDTRIIATIDVARVPASEREVLTESEEVLSHSIDPTLVQTISTIPIRLPKLADRLEDLPILAQYFLERCNRNNNKQVGSIRPDTLDSLALYSWPGELDQLRKTIEAAHAHCTSHAVSPADLPPIFHQAFQATAHRRERPEPIVLDDLLAAIEKEAIARALTQAGGNKSEAATLLGITRPRLYRRLVQLGFVSEGAGAEADVAEANVAQTEVVEAPEFIEQDAAE